ncbi:MAG: RNA polymerase sigma factor, partial [Zavarzinella sp.]|nr:RNA polymerase sigma factor [Zavarzinella sp.]
MATTHPALRHVRRWLQRAGPAAGNDAELVRRFAKQGDQAAFAELVDRHGPMVLAVARRVVADYQAAEDVFQATFLALARRAGRIRQPEALPGWLHRTAYHIGLNAVRARARRQRAEAVRHAPPSASPPDLDARELLAILDQELARLPESLRVPLVLCCLEGLTQDEAATRLGWSPGSVRGRLERGRRLLRDRLARRGLTFAVGAGTT